MPKKTITANSVNEAATEIVKKKRSRPDLTELQTPHMAPGKTGELVQHVLNISMMPKIDTNNAEQIMQRINEYLTYCVQNDMKPDMSGMALAIGVSRKTLWAWENGVDSNKPADVRNSLKKGREMCETIMTQMMQAGALNPITSIFLLKNNHGYTDQQEVIITPNTPADGRDPTEIRSQYIQALPEETE